jgi:hypothetical protein
MTSTMNTLNEPLTEDEIAAGYVLMRNTQAGPTVYTSPSGQQVEWEGAGSLTGADIQPVSVEVLKEVQFQKNRNRGIFEKVTQDQAAILEQHRQEWVDNDHRRRNASLDALEAVSDNDFHMVGCVMPLGMAVGAKTCSVEVPMTVAEQRTKPPLCNEHKSEAPSFYPEETDQMVQGKPVIVWRRISMGARTRQS